MALPNAGMLINFNDKPLLKFEKQLRRLTKNGLPWAVKQTLNSAVDRTAKWAKNRELRKRFTLRNRWVQNSIRTRHSRGGPIERQSAEVGSVNFGLRQQELGGTESSPSVPSTVAAGQGRRSRRTKPVLGRHRAKTIALQSKVRPVTGSAKRQLAARLAIARSRREKHFFLDLGKTQGIFTLHRGKTLQLIRSTGNPPARIKRNPWLQPSVDRITGRPMQQLYKNAVIKQLQRHSLWKR